MLFLKATFALQQLMTNDGRLALENVPVRKGLNSCAFASGKVSVYVWVNKVCVKGRCNRMTLPIWVHSPIILVVSLLREFSAIPFQRA